MSCDRERFINVLSKTYIWFGVSKTNEILCRVAGQRNKRRVFITVESKPASSEALGAFIDLLNCIQGLMSFLKFETKEPQKVQGSDKQPSRPPSATDTIKKLEAQLITSREESEKFRLQCEQLKTDKKDLLKQNETEKKRFFEEREGIIQKWKSKVNELELECQKLSKDSRDQKVEEALKARDKAIGTRDQLENQLGELFRKNDQLEKQFRHLSNENNDLQKILIELNKEKYTLPKEVKEISAEKDQLAKELARKDTEIRKVTEEASSKDLTKTVLKNKEKEIKKLEEKLRGSEASNGNLKRANEDLQKRIGRIQETKLDLVDQLTAKLGSHMTKEQVVKQLMETNAEKIDRLAVAMSAESALENISIHCKPMNIAEEYNLLCSNAWLDAKQALDDLDINEESACVFLTDVLQIALKEATSLFNGILQKIQNVLNIDETVGTLGKKSLEGPMLPLGIITQVEDHLRSTATTVDITSLIKNVKGKLNTKYQKPKEVLTYISESSRLAWKMVIQRPPMSFDDRGVGKPWEGDTVSDLFWGSYPKAKGAVVRYYVNLILMYGEKPMVKGKVMVN